MSGACSLRTCWQRVGSFRRVGELLKVAAYGKALRVEMDTQTGHLRPAEETVYFGGMPLPPRLMKRSSANQWFSGNRRNSLQLEDDKEDDFNQQRDKLVFLKESPNYCNADHEIGKQIG